MKRHNQNRCIGQHAENRALEYLEEQNLILITRNYFSCFGEIDLIMRDNNTLAFVEVKYRTQQHFGNAASMVNIAKQKKIIKTAQSYLSSHYTHDLPPCRFDVVTLYQYNKDNICWLKNAFICE